MSYAPGNGRKRCSPGTKKISTKGEKLRCMGTPKKRTKPKKCKYGFTPKGYCRKRSKK